MVPCSAPGGCFNTLGELAKWVFLEYHFPRYKQHLDFMAHFIFESKWRLRIGDADQYIISNWKFSTYRTLWTHHPQIYNLTKIHLRSSPSVVRHPSGFRHYTSISSKSLLWCIATRLYDWQLWTLWSPSAKMYFKMNALCAIHTVSYPRLLVPYTIKLPIP